MLSVELESPLYGKVYPVPDLNGLEMFHCIILLLQGVIRKYVDNPCICQLSWKPASDLHMYTLGNDLAEYFHLTEFPLLYISTWQHSSSVLWIGKFYQPSLLTSLYVQVRKSWNFTTCHYLCTPPWASGIVSYLAVWCLLVQASLFVHELFDYSFLCEAVLYIFESEFQQIFISTCTHKLLLSYSVLFYVSVSMTYAHNVIFSVSVYTCNLLNAKIVIGIGQENGNPLCWKIKRPNWLDNQLIISFEKLNNIQQTDQLKHLPSYW